MLNDLLNKIDRKYNRYAVKNLIIYIIATMCIIYVFNLYTVFNPSIETDLYSMLTFDRDLILKGQVWRVISFIFLPPLAGISSQSGQTGIFLDAFAVYLCWMIGVGLETQWGSFKFNVYYLLGIAGSIISGFITGGSMNIYLNLSMFLAFAIVYPDFELQLLFFLPSKVKILALFCGIFIVKDLIFGSLSARAAILFSLLNVIIFFWKDLLKSAKALGKRRRRRFFR